MSDSPRDTMPVEEFIDALDNIRCEVLASHLIMIEELRAIREEVYDPACQIRRFFDIKREAVRILSAEKQRQSKMLARILDKRRPE